MTKFINIHQNIYWVDLSSFLLFVSISLCVSIGCVCVCCEYSGSFAIHSFEFTPTGSRRASEHRLQFGGEQRRMLCELFLCWWPAQPKKKRGVVGPQCAQHHLELVPRQLAQRSATNVFELVHFVASASQLNAESLKFARGIGQKQLEQPHQSVRLSSCSQFIQRHCLNTKRQIGLEEIKSIFTF